MNLNKAQLKSFAPPKYNILKHGLREFKSHTILALALVLLILSVLVLVLAVQRGQHAHAGFARSARQPGHPDVARLPGPKSAACSFISCFDIYRCGNEGKDLLVYVYPEAAEVARASNATREFHRIVQYILGSRHHTANPGKACLFVPSLDTLAGEQRLFGAGRNHLVFNVERRDARGLRNDSGGPLAYAMIADVSHSKSDFRRDFDIGLPAWSEALERVHGSGPHRARDWFVAAAQLNVERRVARELAELAARYPAEVRLLGDCSDPRFRCHGGSRYRYPDVLESASFCLIARGERSGMSLLLEALAAECVPVLLNDAAVMPFAEVLDWTRAAVFVRESSLLQTVDTLRRYSPRRLEELRRQGAWLYERYLRSVDRITETLLEIVADRIYPHAARDYRAWNERAAAAPVVPFVAAPSGVSKSGGFTAVVLTYDRVDSLFALLDKLARIPSLLKILVVWNNEHKLPPRSSKWPRLAKPLKVLHTERNLLSNRFYPFAEIESEAVLSIDDDILMLTEDEIEFAYEVWKEFPERIVGFPSRVHVWDNRTGCWKYESEWTNHVSMVLTGAAFYHKYWNYAYTVHLPPAVREWVDDHMNCEDIAMNFLVSNVTNKAPIKVTAKKKFRCPECVSTEMLSADSKHMMQRSECVNKFSAAFGRLPLVPVEFRADPVLYKDSFPDKLKRFNNVGNL